MPIIQTIRSADFAAVSWHVTKTAVGVESHNPLHYDIGIRGTFPNYPGIFLAKRPLKE